MITRWMRTEPLLYADGAQVSGLDHHTSAEKYVALFTRVQRRDAHVFTQLRAENPIQLDEKHSMEDWLTRLAARPLTRVNDPRRSSVPGPAAEESALRNGREVSPRDLVERILAERHVSKSWKAR